MSNVLKRIIALTSILAYGISLETTIYDLALVAVNMMNFCVLPYYVVTTQTFFDTYLNLKGIKQDLNLPEMS